ncbi:hypothetical protein ECC02_011183 [Trypanosoma cruzi]|uniref:Secreted protein n=1 Tax=Trypanosoma cruzi TaxID=5693 RepID=A0A7J6XNS3_TRYCR|nr:hypothetical protein ECC02_011183 [Trypanosoma cruzi]
MHSTCCLLRCVGAWGCCACRVPSAQRLRSTCTHPISRRAASARRIASVTSQWVAAGLVLPRRSSEWSSRGGIVALNRGASSTLLVFLIAIVLRVHIPLSSRATGHGSTFRSHHSFRVPSSHRAITRSRTRTPSQQPSLTRTSSCASLQEPTGRRAHGQSSSRTVESPNAAEPTCDSTRKQKERHSRYTTHSNKWQHPSSSSAHTTRQMESVRLQSSHTAPQTTILKSNKKQ